MDGQATSMRMWRKELPPLICLARAADTNLDLPRLRRAPKSRCRCLFQETCLSPCFAFQTSPSQRERDFVKGPLFPQKVWVLMNQHFLLKSVQPVALAARGPRTDLCEVQGNSQQIPDTTTDLSKAWRCVTLDLCHILVVP